ncbi:hypothetical protein, partial [Brevibacillus borstelensis]|uniref:hypothetical protein n=1 Tax=Brevibacillus borstelensis TaxID=45462 RepID=UPI001D0A9DEC
GRHPCLELTVGTANPRSGLSPYSYRPCWAHQKKQPCDMQDCTNDHFGYLIADKFVMILLYA